MGFALILVGFIATLCFPSWDGLKYAIYLMIMFVTFMTFNQLISSHSTISTTKKYDEIIYRNRGNRHKYISGLSLPTLYIMDATSWCSLRSGMSYMVITLNRQYILKLPNLQSFHDQENSRVTQPPNHRATTFQYWFPILVLFFSPTDYLSHTLPKSLECNLNLEQ